MTPSQKSVVLQNIIDPKKTVCKEENLYFRKIGIPVSPNINGFPMEFVKNQRVNFDTYFNSFSLLKWHKYAAIDNVQLKLKLKGTFVVQLIHYTLEVNDQLAWNIVGEHTVSSRDAPTDFSFEFITQNPFGMLAFTLRAEEDNSIFYGGCFTSNVIESCIKNIKIGLGICTYKREEYIKNNMDNITNIIFNNNNSILKDKIEVFISDNAKTLTTDMFRSDLIHVFKNKNTGGSGGFTRTMIEINKDNLNGAGFTHILLMDDDIVFDPESIYRTYTMLSLVKKEYEESFIGGAMFFIDKEYVQHASGEYWHGYRYDSFITTYNTGLDMRDLKNIARNEFLTNANYQAWWYCAIPLTICKFDNLGLPLFIKSDDIEYSIRNLKNLILLNGIAVWHEAFESKYSVSNEYYTVRNYLITASIHRIKLTTKDIKKFIKNYTIHYLRNFKYLEIAMFYKGLRDFLRGVDYLKSIDPEAYHKEIMKNSYKMQDVADLEFPFTESLYHTTLAKQSPKSKLRKFLRKITLNGQLLPSQKVIALGVWGGTAAQTYKAKYIIRFEPRTKKAFVLERDLKKFIKSIVDYRRIIKEVDRDFIAAREDFRKRSHELTNLEFWQQKL